MPLNIKNIFSSDLDPNRTDFWSTDKLDKLNYNFNQLSEGGDRGPLGVDGINGPTGFTGVTGPQGNEGIQGNQGVSGTDANLNWLYVDTLDNRTIYPMIEPTDYSGVAVIIGANSNLDEFSQAAIWNNTSQLKVIANPGDKQVSFRIGDSKYDIKFDGDDLFLGKLNTDPNPLIVKEELNNSQVRYNVRGSINRDLTNKLNISDSLIESFGDAEFGNLTANGAFKFNNDAETSKILTSVDASGAVAWKNKAEALSLLPVGSIISIKPSDFNNTNFWIQNASEEVDGVLQLFYGRGRVNTSYEGWYICNGETWNYLGNNSNEVPNLNSFSYHIQSNGKNQPNVDGGDDTPILIAGLNLTYSDTNTSGTLYNVDSSYDYSDVSETFGTSLNSFISRNVHIVKLDSSYLTWSTVGGAVITEPIVLSDPSTSSSIACSTNMQTYNWTGSGITWNNTTADLTGVALYDSNNNLAPSNKWYAKDGLARYWNGISFTTYEVCPIQQNINLGVANSVLTLNGSVPSSGTYTIDALAFKDATSLKFGGVNASAGWYKVALTDNGARRYWNGTSFLGETITTKNVYHAGTQEVSTYSTSSACQYVDSSVKIYYATNSTVIPTSNILQDIYGSSAIVYVHRDWLGATVGEWPLVKIYSQNSLGGGSGPYKSILDDYNSATYRSTITTSSTILSPVVCSNYYISGTTYINVSNSTASGQVVVTNTPAIITLSAFGGAGGPSCYTEATLSIPGAGLKVVFANAGATNSDTIQINSTGSFSFFLSGDFGCSSGNSANIS